MSAERRYLFSPLERRGVVAGLRGAQLAVLGVGLVVSVGALRRQPSAGGLALALLISAAALSIVFVKVRDRSVDQWIPLVVRFGTGRVGAHSAARRRARRRAVPVACPPALKGLHIGALERGLGQPAAVLLVDRLAGTLGSVLAVRGHAFALLDSTDKDRRLAAWGSVLASMARHDGCVSRVQWVERTVGGDADALGRHLVEQGVLDRNSAPVRSYASLVSEAGPLTQEHECYVVLTVSKRAGKAVLQRELRLLEAQLKGADLDVRGALTAREFAALLRTSFDLTARTTLARRAGLHPDLAGARLGSSWPASTQTSWATYRTDAAHHATFWVAEWPRVEVGPDFLSPLLLRAGGHRTASLTMAPVNPGEGFREAEAARTAAIADDELRQRAGFLGTARRRREHEGVARREAELADGHAAYRFSGYVTISAEEPEALEDACGEVVQLAHQCRLDLRRLHGLQDLAFTWTLPLGRGLA
jgi:hypothetical protein